jgi:hypothetical protein
MGSSWMDLGIVLLAKSCSIPNHMSIQLTETETTLLSIHLPRFCRIPLTHLLDTFNHPLNLLHLPALGLLRFLSLPRLSLA